MNTTSGKIARLPRAIRDELNRRLHAGEQGRQLVAWLNRLPEVQAVLRAEFGGQPVNEPNLTNWKQGGFRVWLARQEDLEITRDQAADAAELAQAGPVADHLSRVLAARYAAFFARWNGDPAGVNRRELATLHTLCEDVTQLRRGEHSAARLQLEREEQAWRSRGAEDEALQFFLAWARLPVVKEILHRPGLSEGEITRRMRDVFGLPPALADSPADQAAPDQAQPGPEPAGHGLLNPAPPGLPALVRLDERLKEMKKQGTPSRGLSREAIRQIQEQAKLL